VTYHAHRLAGDGRGIEIDVAIDGARLTLQGQGSGPIDAAVDALGLPLSVHAYEERATGTGAGAQALAIVEASLHGLPGATFGVGLHHNIVTASVQAVVGVANRLLQRRHAQGFQARATAMV
jgi:2-isopropylmalate synthase